MVRKHARTRNTVTHSSTYILVWAPQYVTHLVDLPPINRVIFVYLLKKIYYKFLKQSGKTKKLVTQETGNKKRQRGRIITKKNL